MKLPKDLEKLRDALVSKERKRGYAAVYLSGFEAGAVAVLKSKEMLKVFTLLKAQCECYEGDAEVSSWHCEYCECLRHFGGV